MRMGCCWFLGLDLPILSCYIFWQAAAGVAGGELPVPGRYLYFSLLCARRWICVIYALTDLSNSFYIAATDFSFVKKHIVDLFTDFLHHIFYGNSWSLLCAKRLFTFLFNCCFTLLFLAIKWKLILDRNLWCPCTCDLTVTTLTLNLSKNEDVLFIFGANSCWVDEHICLWWTC
jgi:hypothetical protein